MLPSILARQYQEGLIDYIDTSFPITNPIFKGSIRNMLNTKDGHMHIAEDKGLDFYGKLYSQGELVRIVAKEHTGLLERDDRENLEREFKKSKDIQKPWDTNLLSCTPTLEMGIDIGDLSTVILSSIPPAQANYAQRAGRGGRKDGNALTVAIANARPHDLYFYQDPMEMIAGAVEPPKVFLKASAVLARQFTAYCIGYLDHLQVMSTGMIFLLWVIHIREYIEIRQYFQNAELMSAEEAAT